MTIRAMRWLYLGNRSRGVSLRFAGGVSGFSGRPARSNACCSVSAGTAPIRKSKTRSNRPRGA